MKVPEIWSKFGWDWYCAEEHNGYEDYKLAIASVLKIILIKIGQICWSTLLMSYPMAIARMSLAKYGKH